MKNLLCKITLLLATVFTISACQNNDNHKENLNINNKKMQNNKTEIVGDLTGSYYKGNYVYGAAMNLAWNDLSDNIIRQEIKLKTEDEDALATTKKLNQRLFEKDDLDEESYYIKSGYGQETINEINKEVKTKFPDKTFQELEIELADKEIISYAYFLKEVEYQTPFSNMDMNFLDDYVKGFYAKDEEQKENIKIYHYENDDRFIISLNLKEQEDELYLAKGYDTNDPAEVIEFLKNFNSKNKTPQTIKSSDAFRMPKMDLTYHRNYKEMISKYFENEGFRDYFIGQMYENIKFSIDEKGARVENEGVISGPKNAPAAPEDPKYFYLNKPFWLIMKRKNSENPYFILGINNSEFMEKTE